MQNEIKKHKSKNIFIRRELRVPLNKELLKSVLRMTKDYGHQRVFCEVADISVGTIRNIRKYKCAVRSVHAKLETAVLKFTDEPIQP